MKIQKEIVKWVSLVLMVNFMIPDSGFAGNPLLLDARQRMATESVKPAAAPKPPAKTSAKPAGKPAPALVPNPAPPAAQPNRDALPIPAPNIPTAPPPAAFVNDSTWDSLMTILGNPTNLTTVTQTMTPLTVFSEMVKQEILDIEPTSDTLGYMNDGVFRAITGLKIVIWYVPNNSGSPSIVIVIQDQNNNNLVKFVKEKGKPFTLAGDPPVSVGIYSSTGTRKGTLNFMVGSVSLTVRLLYTFIQGPLPPP